MITTQQAANALGISARRIRALIKAGKLPATKHGRDWLIKASALELAHIKERKTGRPHEPRND